MRPARLCVVLSVCSWMIACGALTVRANWEPGFYGPGIGADSLGNQVVGGKWGNVISYRFRAGHSGSLQSILIFLISDKAGYAGGTGGKIQVSVNADDGTAAHNPSRTILASYVITNALALTPSNNFPVLTFPVPPALVSGQLYHIVFTNIDASPTTNFLSVDDLYQQVPLAPTQPSMSDVNCAVLVQQQGLAWAEHKGYTPILQLNYAGGTSEGVGYMEAWTGAPQAVSGSSAVRETFTVSGSSEAVSNVSVRVARVRGSDPLKVRLETGSGSLIEQGTVPAASIPLTNPVSYTWATFTFASAHTLLPGTTYHLDLEATSSSTYEAYPIRKGSAENFRNTTYFADGYAQFKQGTTWVGWTQWGQANRTDGDLQFSFELAADSETLTTFDVAADSITSSGATITWNTSQSASSEVEYGTTTAYARTTSLNTSMVSTHLAALTGLTAGTTYHYRVLSTNASGSGVASGDLTFTTP